MASKNLGDAAATWRFPFIDANLFDIDSRCEAFHPIVQPIFFKSEIVRHASRRNSHFVGRDKDRVHVSLGTPGIVRRGRDKSAKVTTIAVPTVCEFTRKWTRCVKT